MAFTSRVNTPFTDEVCLVAKTFHVISDALVLAWEVARQRCVFPIWIVDAYRTWKAVPCADGIPARQERTSAWATSGLRIVVFHPRAAIRQRIDVWCEDGYLFVCPDRALQSSIETDIRAAQIVRHDPNHVAAKLAIFLGVCSIDRFFDSIQVGWVKNGRKRTLPLAKEFAWVGSISGPTKHVCQQPEGGEDNEGRPSHAIWSFPEVQ